MLCCSVEGLFPQQIPAQSVQSSGGDERWGLGGDPTTHFPGKSGSGSPVTTRAPSGSPVSLKCPRRAAAAAAAEQAAGGWQPRLLCLQHVQPVPPPPLATTCSRASRLLPGSSPAPSGRDQGVS